MGSEFPGFDENDTLITDPDNNPIKNPNLSKIYFIEVPSKYDRQDVIDDLMNYPAGYGQGVISVGAIANNGGLWYKSQRNSRVDVVAPGYSIYSTYWGMNPPYTYNTGTSMAAPHVSGLATLLKSYNPTLTNDDIKQIINRSAIDMGENGYDSYFANGRVNAKNAIDMISSPNVIAHFQAIGETSHTNQGYMFARWMGIWEVV